MSIIKDQMDSEHEQELIAYLSGKKLIVPIERNIDLIIAYIKLKHPGKL